MRTEQSRLLVHITDWAEVPAHNFKIGILTDIVLGHLEHPQMEISDWTEGAACYQDDGLLFGIAENRRQAMGWERVIWGICELVGILLGHDGKRRPSETSASAADSEAILPMGFGLRQHALIHGRCDKLGAETGTGLIQIIAYRQ